MVGAGETESTKELVEIEGKRREEHVVDLEMLHLQRVLDTLLVGLDGDRAVEDDVRSGLVGRRDPSQLDDAIADENELAAREFERKGEVDRPEPSLEDVEFGDDFHLEIGQRVNHHLGGHASLEVELGHQGAIALVERAHEFGVGSAAEAVTAHRHAEGAILRHVDAPRTGDHLVPVVTTEVDEADQLRARVVLDDSADALHLVGETAMRDA